MAAVSRGRVRRDDLEGRRARADTILEAAGELIERWGYDKTTVEDIASAAGVAKGTIYLHWKTREALFVALLRRERVALLADVRQQLAADPASASARTLFTHLAIGIDRRPLLKAVLLRDMAVLGRLAAQRGSHPSDLAWRAEFFGYLAALRAQGAIHEDRDDRTVANLVSVAFTGTFVSSRLMPDEYLLSPSERAELVADIIHGALDPGRRLNAKARAAVARSTVEYVDAALTVARHHLDEAIGLAGKRKEDA